VEVKYDDCSGELYTYLFNVLIIAAVIVSILKSS